MASTNTANYSREVPIFIELYIVGLVSSIGELDIILFQFTYSSTNVVLLCTQLIHLHHTHLLFHDGRFHIPQTSRCSIFAMKEG